MDVLLSVCIEMAVLPLASSPRFVAAQRLVDQIRLNYASFN